MLLDVSVCVCVLCLSVLYGVHVFVQMSVFFRLRAKTVYLETM